MIESGFMVVLIPMLLSFCITYGLIPLCMAFAVYVKFVDTPDGTIKMHERPTPYLGGVAIFIGFFIAAFGFLGHFHPYVPLFAGLFLLLAMGLVDDLWVITPWQKFLAQVLVVICFLKSGFYFKELFFSKLWAVPITFLWMISIINTFNLVDVMDGLAATISICAAIHFLLIAWWFHSIGAVILLASFLGGVAAFLCYNFPPASLYMGDAGALFIGGFFAVIPVFISWSEYTPHGFLTPGIVLAIPILEVLFLIIIRLYKKIPIYRGSADHFCHYLLRMGMSKKQILGLVIVFAFIFNTLSTGFLYGIVSLPMLMFCGVSIVGLWGLMLLYAHSHAQIEPKSR